MRRRHEDHRTRLIVKVTMMFPVVLVMAMVRKYRCRDDKPGGENDEFFEHCNLLGE
jgi:hypothetical protein